MFPPPPYHNPHGTMPPPGMARPMQPAQQQQQQKPMPFGFAQQRPPIGHPMNPSHSAPSSMSPSVASLFNSAQQQPHAHLQQQHAQHTPSQMTAFAQFAPPPQHAHVDADESPAPGQPLVTRHSTYTVTDSAVSPHKPLTSDFGAFPRSFDSRTGRVIAAGCGYICYTVANGHIRLIAMIAGKPGLLKGHTGRVLDMELIQSTVAGDTLLVSTSDSGEVIVWRLNQSSGDVAFTTVVKFTHTTQSAAGYYQRVRWIDSHSVAVGNSDELVAVTVNDSYSNAVIDLSSTTTSTRPLTTLSKITDFALSVDRSIVTIGQLNGVVTVNDLSNLTHITSIKPHGSSAISRILSVPQSLVSGRRPSPWLLTVGKHNSELKLWHTADNYRLLSSLTISSPQSQQWRVTALDVDPSGSFLVLSFDQGVHTGFLVVHLRRSGDDIRFDYVSQFQSNQPVLAFALTRENDTAVEWDGNTAASVSMYACTTKPIVQYHLHAANVAQLVFDSQLVNDDYQQSAADVEGEQEQQGEGDEPVLLTPQALTSSLTAPAVPLSVSAPPTATPSLTPKQSMSIAFTPAVQPTPPPAPGLVKILQRPPAINSAVLSSSAGSPSSSPTTSHQTAASLVSPTMGSPEMPRTPVPSPANESPRPATNSAVSTIAGVLVDPQPIKASALARTASTSGKSMPSPPSRSNARTPQPGGQPITIQKRPSASEIAEAPARTAAAANVSDANASTDGNSADSKDARREKQEANLLARLDKLFSRQFSKVGTIIKAETDREMAERAQAEKVRLDSVVKLVSQSLNASLDTTVSKVLSKALPAVIDKAVKDSLSSNSTNLASPGAPTNGTVDADAVSAAVIAALRSPLSESFKSSFQSVLLPGFEASTRAMLKQIESVNSRMSDNHERRMEALTKERSTEIETLHSVIQSLNSTVQSLQAQAQQQTDTMIELKFLLHQYSLTGASQSSVSPVTSTVSSPSESGDIKAELSTLLHSHQYEQAFFKALSLGKLPMVVWLCQQLDPRSLTTASTRLSSPLVLSLIQQLGFNLRDDSGVKLSWLRECVMAFDRSDPAISKHVPGVLREVLSKLNEQWEAQWRDTSHALHEQARTVRQLLQMCVGTT